MLDYLINELGVDGVAKDKDNMSCVHAATQGNHPTTVKVCPSSPYPHTLNPLHAS